MNWESRREDVAPTRLIFNEAPLKGRSGQKENIQKPEEEKK